MLTFLNVPKRQLLSQLHGHSTINAAGVAHQSRGKANVKKYVIISESNDIFTNLAVEDWLYNNWNFTNTHVLMLWRNDPCVVIGKRRFDVNDLTDVHAIEIESLQVNSRIRGSNRTSRSWGLSSPAG